MNKNSYVTAALFVVFVLLTVFYISIGDSNDSTTNKVGSTSTLPKANLEINPTDAQSGSELVSNQESGDDETETAGTSSEVSAIQVQRTEAAKAKSQLQADLTAIIASKDADAEEKSEAKDNLEKINKDAQHESILESMIKAKGYSDVLVRVNEETVQVHLQLSESQSEPTLEQTNEIIMMVKTEFTTDPDVLVQLTPIN
ncbi:SpoIIIAH-like family protein [Turicibacter sp.]|uniref:SpoIIIAH-like family protein n=1 Tax=Turicibacter sp. TaxID=2049042 RepID=UPI001B7B4E60|nr:SpoIIIAH-like family protein [Turicibacter sp.]MBP3904660.1 SpoIIIAH-like family protein [Turicibacter sp.]MBP3908346.1 SpoIIIAH-like family protein [Turicibacter sp.]